MSLADKLAAATAAQRDDARRARSAAPKGFETGVRYASGRPSEVTLNLREIPEDEAKWREEIGRATGLSIPAERKVELTQVRMWGDPAAPSIYCRFSISDRVGEIAHDIDDLVRAAREKARKGKALAGDMAYVVALGDTQIGKPDGDGTDGTIGRVLDSTQRAVGRLKELRKAGRSLGPIYLLWLGDCIEGLNSQGGANIWRTDLTLTEQVRVVRRLMLEQVKAFAPLTDRLVLASVPGNHDETHRIAGKQYSRTDDSWAVDAASAVADALELAGTYQHVSVVVPGKDALTITLDIAGTVTTCAHGHQFRQGNAHNWWKDQAHGMRPAGDSTLLLAGHLHHLRVEAPGAKTFIQVPAMDGGSAWWEHATGQVAATGAVTMTVGAGHWSDLLIV